MNWVCKCGAENDARYCETCGREFAPPAAAPAAPESITNKIVAGVALAFLVIAWVYTLNNHPQTISRPSPAAAQGPTTIQEPPNSAPVQPTEPSASSLSDVDLKKMKDAYRFDLALIRDINKVLAAPSAESKVEIYCEHNVREMNHLLSDHDPTLDANGQNNIAVCSNRIFSGVDRMFTDQELIEKRDKTSADLRMIEARLGAASVASAQLDDERNGTIAPPQVAPPQSSQPVDHPVPDAAQTSGDLHAIADANGVAVFSNLPAERLHFDFDHQAWQPTIEKQPDGRKTLTMRSVGSTKATVCNVHWEIVQ